MLGVIFCSGLLVNLYIFVNSSANTYINQIGLYIAIYSKEGFLIF